MSRLVGGLILLVFGVLADFNGFPGAGYVMVPMVMLSVHWVLMAIKKDFGVIGREGSVLRSEFLHYRRIYHLRHEDATLTKQLRAVPLDWLSTCLVVVVTVTLGITVAQVHWVPAGLAWRTSFIATRWVWALWLLVVMAAVAINPLPRWVYSDGTGRPKVINLATESLGTQLRCAATNWKTLWANDRWSIILRSVGLLLAFSAGLLII
jgi:hypothetical protein